MLDEKLAKRCTIDLSVALQAQHVPNAAGIAERQANAPTVGKLFIIAANDPS